MKSDALSLGKGGVLNLSDPNSPKVRKFSGFEKKSKKLTSAGKVTNKLSNLISLKVAERSETKSAKRSFSSKYLQF